MGKLSTTMAAVAASLGFGGAAGNILTPNQMKYVEPRRKHGPSKKVKRARKAQRIARRIERRNRK